ncbi:DUF3662 and FHA domain-containing protein [Coriobacteriia bacterium Es71-Z0120]|uniref:FhaA domain-containing protein n=1 Tax=Parvivirga hydrogeniphila TaxID=2939460 RepID=UPI002260B982|nr:DUF3662 and FHA domain-containing protein [Parvivirga hydrogeniphila]MCL4078259.1 DUF3662 and FHA domain-containing protein [Parvivirga hydrogeniphila]
MGVLADFEDRIARSIEGLFAGAFKAPVQPVEIAKALARAMDDGRVVGAGAVYAPTSFTVALSEEDADEFGEFTATLAGELSTYLADHAREQGYRLQGRPAVRFVTHEDLRLGRFRVAASLAPHEEAPAHEKPRCAPGLATVTVDDFDHDIVLDGEQVLVGRLKECQIQLDDANVSRRHAAFIRLPDGWAIEDLDSTNGTRVNGRSVSRARLHDGDVIEVGLSRLVYHEPKE